MALFVSAYKRILDENNRKAHPNALIILRFLEPLLTSKARKQREPRFSPPAPKTRVAHKRRDFSSSALLPRPPSSPPLGAPPDLRMRQQRRRLLRVLVPPSLSSPLPNRSSAACSSLAERRPSPQGSAEVAAGEPSPAAACAISRLLQACRSCPPLLPSCCRVAAPGAVRDFEASRKQLAGVGA